MAADRFQSRQQKLISSLKASGAEALLVTNFTNVSWLTGFSGDDSYLLIGKSRMVLISDSRYQTQIAQECPGLEFVIRDRTVTVVAASAKTIEAQKLKKVAFESGSMTVDGFEKVRLACPGVEFIPLAGAVEDLRMIKDAAEIEEIRRAVHIAQRGFDVLRGSLRADQTELEVAHDLEHAMRKLGAKGTSFPPIIAVGPRAALPHARPTQATIGSAGFVLVDWGAQMPSGYRSDLTRVLVTSKMSPKLEKVYGVVLRAQLAGIEKIGPGVKCADVDATARKVIEDAGFGKQFGHGLGHGIGLDIHENPRMSSASETILQPGMIVTVEPGIYLEGWGGVRLEDDVLVTKTGCEILSSVSKTLDQMLIPL